MCTTTSARWSPPDTTAKPSTWIGSPTRTRPWGSFLPDEQRDGVPLTNLDQDLLKGSAATKRDLVDYLDAMGDRMIPHLHVRLLSVIRVLLGQETFMQKNVPKCTPEWVSTVSVWAESSQRQVSYALCNDRRTLMWLANQRTIEFHPGLSLTPSL